MGKIKRLYGIRHIRWAYHSYLFWSWWESVGHLLGAVPNPSDLEYLDGIWSGEI